MTYFWLRTLSGRLWRTMSWSLTDHVVLSLSSEPRGQDVLSITWHTFGCAVSGAYIWMRISWNQTTLAPSNIHTLTHTHTHMCRLSGRQHIAQTSPRLRAISGTLIFVYSYSWCTDVCVCIEMCTRTILGMLLRLHMHFYVCMYT